MKLFFPSPIRSTFQPSPFAGQILRTGNILGPQESPNKMIERVVCSLCAAERFFHTSDRETRQFSQDLLSCLDNKECVMSTPIMHNAGRYSKKPLAACSVPPLDLNSSYKEIENVVNAFHRNGMGTGFSLNNVADPIPVLKALNRIAVAGAKSGREDRPVGNMAVISIYHPRVMDVINIKIGADERGEEWKFNISIDVDEQFFRALEKDGLICLQDGTRVRARSLFTDIANAAYRCGDPGLVFLDRLNADNPTPKVGLYTSVAPCGEVGLMPGETCQFGYINLGKCISSFPEPSINLSKIEHLTKLMVRALDNALELSGRQFSLEVNRNVMRAKRKIGVGICGLADMLIALRIPYASEKGVRVATDVVAFINYISKQESHKLARTRGSFGAMDDPGSRYTEHPGFIEQKYGSLETRYVSKTMWQNLGVQIRTTQHLRNSITISLPPTGRSGLIIDASTGVEPLFSLINPDGNIYAPLLRDLQSNNISPNSFAELKRNGSLRALTGIPETLRFLYRTALEINPEQHIAMVSGLQRVVDDSISKTINLPSNSSPDYIARLFLRAYQLNLKGITVFRDGCRFIQPREVSR